MNTIGKKIRLLRHQQGWSQDDVAKKLGISIPAFSKIETGISDINLSRLEQIASLFGFSLVELLVYYNVAVSHILENIPCCRVLGPKVKKDENNLDVNSDS